MRKTLVVVICALGLASLAAAQTKLDSKWHCDKPTTQQKLDVGDTADHAYVIAQGNCTATSSSAGEKAGTYTEFQETWKSSFTNHGRLVVTMDNGDKTYYNYQGTGNPVKKSAMNKWKIGGGTGSHKTAAGSGSCEGKLADDGSSDWTCTGSAPAAAK